MQPSRQGNSRPGYGQSMIEAVVGIVVILIAVFALADIVVVVQAGIINGDLAAKAARAAANQADATAATSVAEEVANKFATSSIISKVDSIKATLNSPVSGQLTVDSTIEVNVPFPVPGLNMNPVKLHTQSVGPMLK